ncbi:MAG: copper resistance protein CopD [Deltaproteobacteria bacterium]|nr:copper resistance protein CopD [Deltaproteobacteria bacterium]
MYKLVVALHLIGAAVWIGGHIVLCVTVLPRALRNQDPNPIREFEDGYEPLGVASLILQLITGLWLTYHWLPDVSAWFSFEPGLSRDIFLKFVLLGATVLLAAHAQLRIHPRLSPKNLGFLAIHVVAITILSLLFLMTGIAIRTGGWW